MSYCLSHVVEMVQALQAAMDTGAHTLAPAEYRSLRRTIDRLQRTAAYIERAEREIFGGPPE
jgi:hypothetical protein